MAVKVPCQQYKLSRILFRGRDPLSRGHHHSQTTKSIYVAPQINSDSQIIYGVIVDIMLVMNHEILGLDL